MASTNLSRWRQSSRTSESAARRSIVFGRTRRAAIVPLDASFAGGYV
jgi:hypothetical protein